MTSEEKEFEGPFKPAKVLKQGSVLDILKGPGKIYLPTFFFSYVKF